MTLFKLSVFWAIQLNAEILKQLSRLFRTCCLQSGILEPEKD
jgi:hypothetical protein